MSGSAVRGAVAAVSGSAVRAAVAAVSGSAVRGEVTPAVVRDDAGAATSRLAAGIAASPTHVKVKGA